MSVLVGKPAPDFKAEAVHLGQFTQVELSSYRGSKYVVLFFYPRCVGGCPHPRRRVATGGRDHRKPAIHRREAPLSVRNW